MNDLTKFLSPLGARDLDEAADAAWVRAKVEEGLAAGVIDKDAREVLREIIVEIHTSD